MLLQIICSGRVQIACFLFAREPWKTSVWKMQLGPVRCSLGCRMMSFRIRQSWHVVFMKGSGRTSKNGFDKPKTDVNCKKLERARMSGNVHEYRYSMQSDNSK